MVPGPEEALSEGLMVTTGSLTTLKRSVKSLKMYSNTYSIHLGRIIATMGVKEMALCLRRGIILTEDPIGFLVPILTGL